MATKHPTLETMVPSGQSEMDDALAALAAHKTEWASVNIPRRIELLDQIRRDVHTIEQRWIDASIAAKGAEPATMAEGEEWHGLTIVYRQIRFLRRALLDIDRFGKPRIPGKVTTRSNGQVVAEVIPYDWKDKLSLLNIRAEVWMEPSVSLEKGGIPQASFYRQKERIGRVCLVLAAGNVGGLVPQDLLFKLFVEGQVVAVKMNPVNDYLGVLLEEGFASLVKCGYLRFLHGGGREGGYLCNHPSVDEVHMTGSDRTYDAIVFGTGAEGRAHKHARRPQFTKRFTAELGNVSPVIVVPGPWGPAELKKFCTRLGSWLVPNAGCNCITPRMIIQMKNWEHRQALIQETERFLEETQTRTAYYPGAEQIHQEFVQAHPNARLLGKPREGHLPWTFISNVDASNADDVCFRREPFLGLFSETGLDAASAAEFVDKAVEFANRRLWGNLAATLVVHPASMKDREVAAAVERGIANLRYGSVVVNHWGALAHYTMITPWGGYPGNEPHDVQSGTGFVNNPLMFDQVQKSVVYSDFLPLTDPYLANLPSSYRYYRQDTRYHFEPNLLNLARLLWEALTVK